METQSLHRGSRRAPALVIGEKQSEQGHTGSYAMVVLCVYKIC